MNSLFLFIPLLGSFFESSPQHIKINSNLSRELSKNISSEWSLKGGWCGGKLNPKLDIVSYDFNSCEKLSKEQIRKLYVEVMEYMLYAYNTNIQLRPSLGNFPFENKNLEISINFLANENTLGQIKYVKGFNNKIIYSYVTSDMSFVRDSETFEEAYFKVYGREWDPFKYGDCQKGECP